MEVGDLANVKRVGDMGNVCSLFSDIRNHFHNYCISLYSDFHIFITVQSIIFPKACCCIPFPNFYYK